MRAAGGDRRSAMLAARDEVARARRANRLRVIGEASHETQTGFLIAYGADLDDLVRRSALQMAQDPEGRARRRPADRAADQVRV